MSSSERRYFENKFEDYDGRTSLQSPNDKVRGWLAYTYTHVKLACAAELFVHMVCKGKFI